MCESSSTTCEPFGTVCEPFGTTCESLLARLESAYSLIWGSHKIWGKGGEDTLDLL